MPELPEVETTLRGLAPFIVGAEIEQCFVRCPKLRWPIDASLPEILSGQRVHAMSRRGKYILMTLDQGTLILHLGMSGRICILTSSQPAKRHDHIDIVFSGNHVMRYTDPRRFGALLWTNNHPFSHPLLNNLGVEPLTSDLTVDYLLQKAAQRRVSMKPFIMDNKILVGVGNIYATEALFLAGIHPAMPAGLLTRDPANRLIQAIQKILNAAIEAGGTTLKDFVNSEGKPGYFTQQLHVYGRSGLPCFTCQTILQSCKLGQRSSVYCQHCQPEHLIDQF